MKTKFNERIKLLRVERGLSQEQLGKDLNVSRTAVNDWENRSTETSFSMLMEIAKYFNVTTDYLLGVIDEIQ